MTANNLSAIHFDLPHAMRHFAGDLAEIVHVNFIAHALNQRGNGHPIRRSLCTEVAMDLEDLFDELAMNPAWSVCRLEPRSLMLFGEAFHAFVAGKRKLSTCALEVEIWAETPGCGDKIKAGILEAFGKRRSDASGYLLDWRFISAKGEIKGAIIEERCDELLLDEAYPFAGKPIGQFIQDYLRATESVLVLQGPPGTGKTRLIRSLLGYISKSKGENALALYTGDAIALDSDEIFIEFITGEHDAFIIEDADLLLNPRAHGNQLLHRFLNIADGVARTRGRKIVFSTNLPNMRDIDEALVRPGRCFAHAFVREHQPAEARLLLARLGGADDDRVNAAFECLQNTGKRSFSLAEIHAAFRMSGAAVLSAAGIRKPERQCS